MRMSRKPDIVADAAYAILSNSSAKYTGNFFIDEEVLAKEGMTDFGKYAVDASQKLWKDFFLD
jgi:citronellol/citronellal dehydrogenase